MHGDLPLNGCDYLMLGFDYELRRKGYAGNSCQIVLELATAISPEALRRRVVELANRYPILRSRPGGLFSPKWNPLPASIAFPQVRVHRESPQLCEQISDEPLAIRQGELFRFDLVERGSGRMDVVFTWTHALMDAPSAEHFLAVVGREDVAPPATATVAQSPKKPLKDRLLLARKNVNQLSDFCKAPPRTVGVRRPKAPPVQRYRVEKFSAEETARIRANGVKLCGALGDAQFHAAVAMVELHRLHQTVGKPSPSYVLPVPVSLRPKGRIEPVFSNQIAMLMVQFLPEQLVTTAAAVATLKTQLAQALRDRRIEAGVALTGLSRGLPFPLYLYILKQHGLRGEICSFFFGDTAAVTPLLTTFFGATIRNFTHIGATTPSPGIGAIFYYFGGELRLTVFHLETHFSAEEMAEFAAGLRTRLLNP
jgi:diacylglycerol O-acyltransferase / wax synthase